MAGTYTIEATTFDSGVSGAFNLKIRADGGGPACRTALNLGATANGSWTAVCTSVHRPGSNARYYTFTVTKPTQVQIDLASSAVDSYLYLLPGSSPSNSPVTSNDNGGGRGNARISRTLAIGTYTLEATTALAGTTGPFTVKVTKIGKDLEDLEGSAEESAE